MCMSIVHIQLLELNCQSNQCQSLQKRLYRNKIDVHVLCMCIWSMWTLREYCMIFGNCLYNLYFTIKFIEIGFRALLKLHRRQAHCVFVCALVYWYCTCVHVLALYIVHVYICVCVCLCVYCCLFHLPTTTSWQEFSQTESIITSRWVRGKGKLKRTWN